MSLIEIILIIGPLAFLSGFALQRGQVCSVLAAKQIVETGRTSRLIAFGYAGAWALIVAVPLAWLVPDVFKMSPGFEPSLLATVAGMTYGAGAFMTGACLFGICSRAVSGSLHFLAAVPGIALGSSLSVHFKLPALLGPPSPSILASPNAVSLTVLTIALGVAGYSLATTVVTHRRAGIGLRKLLTAARWRSSIAMIVIAVTGSVLFATGEPWGYAALMRQTGSYFMGLGNTIAPASIVGSVALFSGACASLYLDGRFSFRRPTFFHTARCFAGGAIMGFAATLIPGGNDIMLLYAVPSLALQGIIAYVAMFATLIALAGLSRWHAPVPWRQTRATEARET